MAEHRHHRLERLGGSLEAARHVDHQRLTALSCKSARKRGHRGALETDAPHLLRDPGHLVFDERCGRLGRNVPRSEPGPTGGDDDGGAAGDRRLDRVRYSLDLGLSGFEPAASQQGDQARAALVFALAMKDPVADCDHVSFAQRLAFAVALFHVPERPPDFSSNLTDSIDTPRSMPFVMSMRVRPATAAAVSASISTPVWPTTRARASTRTAPGTNSKSSVTLDSARGWQSGMSSEVRLAAMMPATLATWMASPFAAVPPLTARRVSGAIRTRHSASASRTVAGLSATSTIRAAPRSSRWVNRFALGTRSGYADGWS